MPILTDDEVLEMLDEFERAQWKRNGTFSRDMLRTIATERKRANEAEASGRFAADESRIYLENRESMREALSLALSVAEDCHERWSRGHPDRVEKARRVLADVDLRDSDAKLGTARIIAQLSTDLARVTAERDQEYALHERTEKRLAAERARIVAFLRTFDNGSDAAPSWVVDAIARNEMD